MPTNTETTSGVLASPTNLLLYGVESIGKTTLVSPPTDLNPVFLDTEAGTPRVNLERIPVSTKAKLAAVVSPL